MVGPTLSDEETRTANLRLQVAFVLFVGLSSGLVALQAGGTLVQLGASVVGGLLLGFLLLVFLRRMFRQYRRV